MAAANHVWTVNGKPVHWASVANPAQIELGDNLDDSVWDRQRSVATLLWSAAPKSGGGMAPSPYVRLYNRPADWPPTRSSCTTPPSVRPAGSARPR